MSTKEFLENRSAYRSSTATVVAALECDARQGLTAAEAHARKQHYGSNNLPRVPPVPAWRKLLAQFWNPLTIMLLIATVVSLLVWWVEREGTIPYEALTIFAIVLLNGILGFVQEHRAEQAMAALRAMVAPTTRVLRDSYVQMIPTSEVVPGDILILEEGDAIAADARVLEAIALRLLEAGLTGESTPVSKRCAPLDQAASIGDQTNMVFSGTKVAAGRGRAIVTATGAATELGQIAGALQHTRESTTPLQRELDRVGKGLGLVVILIALIMSMTMLLVDRIGTLRELVDLLLLVVALAVAATALLL